MYSLRIASILDGMNNTPVSEYICGHKTSTPSLHELELATHAHRWEQIDDIQKNWVRAYMQEVTDVEEELLRDLNLPSITAIRYSVLNQSDNDVSGGNPFKYYKLMEDSIDGIFKEWEHELIGGGQVEKANAIYQYWLLQVFSVGIYNTQKQIRRVRKDPNDGVRLENTYLRAIAADGTKRIKTRLGKYYRPELMKALKRMAKEGRNPFEIGRWLHKNIGEGQSWYWNRLARSEATLGINGAFNSESRRYGVQYERWSAASTACEICSYFDGRMWRIGTGPEPVSHTHPHCLCLREPVYQSQQFIEQPWTRPDPYRRPYTASEWELFRQGR